MDCGVMHGHGLLALHGRISSDCDIVVSCWGGGLTSFSFIQIYDKTGLLLMVNICAGLCLTDGVARLC